MNYVNINQRKCTAVAWLTLFVFVFSTQAVDSFEFYNTLQHLTNWGWVFHGVVAAIRAFTDSAPHILTLQSYGLSVFVAAGIAIIQIMDNSMIEKFEKESGAVLVWTANVAFHYLPPVFWFVVLVREQEKTRKWTKARLLGTVVTQTVLFTLMFASVYGLLFRVQDQYPGAKIDFVTLFALSDVFVILGYGLLFAIAQLTNDAA